MEKLLKQSNSSIWIRNMQVSSIGIVFSALMCFTKDGALIKSAGFFKGYTPYVWSVILLQAIGGLVRDSAPLLF